MMLQAVLYYWMYSLTILKPCLLWHHCLRAMRTLRKAIFYLLRYFYWIIIVDVVLMGVIIEPFWSSLNQSSVLIEIHPLITFGALIIASMTLLSYIVFIVFLRQDLPITHYALHVKKYFFHCIWFSLAFSMLSVIGRFILVMLGITTIPFQWWGIRLMMQIVQLLSLFYWLSGPLGGIKEFLKSLEQAINTVVYNLPFFVFLVFVMGLTDFGVSLFLSGWQSPLVTGREVLQENIAIPLALDVLRKTSFYKIFIFKYLSQLIQFYWIAFLYVWFCRNRFRTYASSLFD